MISRRQFLTGASSMAALATLKPQKAVNLLLPPDEVDHRALLNEGPAAWNDWMLGHYVEHRYDPPTLFDFRDIDLSGRDLRGLQMHGANFTGASFRSSDLRRSVFTCCNFHEADFREADLWFSSMENGGLFGDIYSADFRGAECPDGGWQTVCKIGDETRSFVCETCPYLTSSGNCRHKSIFSRVVFRGSPLWYSAGEIGLNSCDIDDRLSSPPYYVYIAFTKADSPLKYWLIKLPGKNIKRYEIVDEG